MISTSVLIIGGGFHGTFLAGALKKYRKSKKHDFLVLDPLPRLLQGWYKATSQTKVQFLRSSLSHSVAPNFHSLRNYALSLGRTTQFSVSEFSSYKYQERNEFDILQPYFRPSIRLFNDHASEYIRSQKLEETHVQGKVVDIHPEGSGSFRVYFTDNNRELEISAKKIVLCLGSASPPRRPYEIGPEAIAVLDPGSDTIEKERVKNKKIGILGGGLSSGQLSIWALDSGATEVTIQSLEPPTASRFDFDPCYVGPKCVQDFLLLPNSRERIDFGKIHRRPGTMTNEIFDAVLGFQKSGRIRWLSGPSGQQFNPTFVAAGYQEPTLNFGSWIESLPSYAGYPLLKEDLSWAPNFYVSGALALSQIGPPAPNFIGAHLGARRLLPELGIDFTWRFDTRDELK